MAYASEPDYDIGHWLKSVVNGERYWDLTNGEAYRGTILLVSLIGFLARITGIWDKETEAWEPQEPEEQFHPWTAVLKVGLEEKSDA